MVDLASRVCLFITLLLLDNIREYQRYEGAYSVCGVDHCEFTVGDTCGFAPALHYPVRLGNSRKLGHWPDSQYVYEVILANSMV